MFSYLKVQSAPGVSPNSYVYNTDAVDRTDFARVTLFIISFS